MNYGLMAKSSLPPVFVIKVFFKFNFIIIWLHRVLVAARGNFIAACRIFIAACGIFHCGTWASLVASRGLLSRCVARALERAGLVALQYVGS